MVDVEVVGFVEGVCTQQASRPPTLLPRSQLTKPTTSHPVGSAAASAATSRSLTLSQATAAASAEATGGVTARPRAVT